MSKIVIPQDLWEGNDKEAVLVAWLLDDGDEVECGDAVAEVMVDKAQYEITAEADGVLKTLKAPDDEVRLGDVIAELV